jgi:HNH endonuclease
VARAYHRGTPEERFWARVVKSEGCWEWNGYQLVRRGHRTGYGKFGVTSKITVQAHRFAYELCVGPIPEGHIVHHTCENFACVRPDHLEAVPNGEHQRHHLRQRGFVDNQYGRFPVGSG